MSEIQPTQVAEPGKTTIRTIVQTVLGIGIAAGIVVPLAVLIVQEELAAWLPSEAVVVLATVSGVAVAVSGILTRIMAIPQVNSWLANFGLGAGHRPPVYPGEYSALDRADGLGADGIDDTNPQRKV